METVNINNEIIKARINNYLDLIVAEFDNICLEHKQDIDAMLNVCNGDWLMEAVDKVAIQIQNGKFDNMLMPKENNV